MNAFAFEYTHIFLGMVSCHHIMAAFAALVKLLDDQPIPDDIVCEMVMQAINKYNLLPLTGKQQKQFTNPDPNRTKWYTLNIILREQREVS